jgi:hypothetical protein
VYYLGQILRNLNPAHYFLAENGGCIQDLDAATYQTSFPGYANCFVEKKMAD